MRNQYPGTCYRCGQHVEAGAGHFERFFGQWRVQHATCAIQYRGTPDPMREALALERDQILARGQGRKAQRARWRLRKREEL